MMPRYRSLLERELIILELVNIEIVQRMSISNWRHLKIYPAKEEWSHAKAYYFLYGTFTTVSTSKMKPGSTRIASSALPAHIENRKGMNLGEALSVGKRKSVRIKMTTNIDR
eukprot:scaffold1610_cov35-Attheya_sp.AAC.1